MKPVIPYLLICIFLLTLLNWYMWLRASHGSAFSRWVGYVNLYLGSHILYILIVELFFNESRFPDRAPFSLMYGPLVYLASGTNLHNTVSRQKVVMHGAPFAVFMVWFIFLLISGAGPASRSFFSSTLSKVGMMSFCGYAICTCISNDGYIGAHLKHRKLMVLAAMLLLLFMAMISVTTILAREMLSRGETGNLIRIMVYTCMLCAAILIFRYNIHVIFNKLAGERSIAPDLPVVSENNDRQIKYEKSSLDPHQLKQYALQLNLLMEGSQVYLQPDLSLKKLAKLMQIPAHHLTQVLSVEMKMTFYEYLNGLRVQRACQLLSDDPDSTLELIAELSGFNSKASFNRQFKAMKGCTPSEYRLRGE